MTSPRYPHIEVQLTGEDGNAFAIIGAVDKALRRAKIAPAIRDEFKAEAMSGDYNQLLQTCMAWVETS